MYWIALNKKGNLDTAERIDLMNLLMTEFGSERLLGLLTDREFVGHDWFKYLEENKISFDIRIKKNYLTTNTQGSTVKVDCLFHGLKPGELGVLPGKRIITGQNVFLSALRLSDGDLLIVATDREPEKSIERYKSRWEIETLFSCLKGRGFNFEETRLTDLKRIEAIFGVLALAFSWAHKIGDWRHENHQPIKIKNHGRLAISYFRYGLDWIAQALLDMNHRSEQLAQVIDILIRSWLRSEVKNSMELRA